MSVVEQQNAPPADPQPVEQNDSARQPRRQRDRRPSTGGHVGGQVGNANAVKDGAYCTRLTLTKFPRKLMYIANAVNQLRGPLESGVLAAYGQVDITHATIIRGALIQERLLRVWGKRLADRYDKIADDDEALARITDHIERHARLCAEAVKSLELRTKKPEGFWDAKSAEAQPAS